MKIEYKVPEKFESTLKQDTYYGRGMDTYSATDMLKEVRPVILRKRYWDKIDCEIEDRLWAFFGTAFHNVMESAEGKNDLAEQVLSMGRLRGKFDHYDGESKTLYDFKFTSAWSMVFNDGFKDYHIQLSLYAMMLADMGFPVERCCTLLIFRDWKKSEYTRGRYDIPKPYATVDFGAPLKEINGDPIEKWVEKTIYWFDEFTEVDDENLPLCSAKYRWAEPDKYAVMKGKNKRAYRLLESEESAQEFIGDRPGLRVEKREGNQWKRCEYCDVSAFCNQYQNRLSLT